MERFDHLALKLRALEKKHFRRINAEFPYSPDQPTIINGRVQFAAIDKHKHQNTSQAMPVVCAIGINYSQRREPATIRLLPYKGGYRNCDWVAFSTGCSGSTALVITAYNRNKTSWQCPPQGVEPPSPVGCYSSLDATDRSGLLAWDAKNIRQSFILIMINFCPFITNVEWNAVEDDDGSMRAELLRESIMNPYIEELFQEVGNAVDLWIGHSAIYATHWVWPRFLDLVGRHKIVSWLLAPNINPQAHLYLDGWFRQRDNPLFPLFGPEKPSRAKIDQVAQRLSPLLAELRAKDDAQLGGYFACERKPGASWHFVDDMGEGAPMADCYVAAKDLVHDPQTWLEYVAGKNWVDLDAFATAVLNHLW